MELLKKENMQDIAQIKRFMELCSLIPGFGKEFVKDPEGILKKYNLPLTKEDVVFYPVKEPGVMKPVYTTGKAQLYADFMAKKFEYIDETRQVCVPSNEAFKKWRERQINRCRMELGGKSNFLVHVPLTIELADGCSVGCEFCGLNAGRLKSVFRYTDENAKLFRGVLNVVNEIIGHAASEATMYFATEPLDNPDYELFLADFLKEFDKIPQITTATVMRHAERMHKLLKQIAEDGRTIYRFSVLSEELAWKILDEFTPEELLFVELLPQFSEAPSNGFVSTGRNASDTENYDNTISCVSGFVVNMARQEIRLTTPTNATKEHPTGEYILETAHFESVEDFKNIMLGMIRKYMMNIIKPSNAIGLQSYVGWRREGNEIVVESKAGTVAKFDTSKDAQNLYETVLGLIEEGTHTRREIVEKTIQMNNVGGSGTEYLFYIISKLWNMGIAVDKSGQI